MVLIEAGLQRLGLDNGVFEVVCSAEKEQFGKPHPGVYLTAASKLGIEPVKCVAIEDSLNGVIAAKAARMRCIAVPEVGMNAGKRNKFSFADAVLDSLVQLDDTVWSSLAV